MSSTYTTANQELTERLEAPRVTEQLDAVYEDEIPSGLDQVLSALQSRSLPEDHWQQAH